MQKRDKYLLQGLHIIAWIIFVGLSIEAGGLLVNFVFSIYNPEFVDRLYQKLDLSALYAKSQWMFYCIYSFLLAISFLKALLFYMVVMLLYKMDLSNPFSHLVSKKITQLAYCTFSIGLLSYMARQTTKNLQQHGYSVANVNEFWGDSQAFILMAAVIYIIAVIFKKGVELQNENDLTV